MKKGRRDLREKGITLVALVVTIIVLLILAGVTITMALSGSGILNRATSARETHVQAEQNELNALSEADSEIDRLAKGVTGGNGGSGSGSGGSGSGETGENPPAGTKTITDSGVKRTSASDTSVLSTTGPTDVKDTKNNIVKVPKGYGISSESPDNVSDGIIIEDSDHNQYVWIPVGTITKKDGTSAEIKLIRSDFLTNSTTTENAEDAVSSSYYEYASNSSYGNTKAKNLANFISSAKNNGGYYLARYEAGIDASSDQYTYASCSGISASMTYGTPANMKAKDGTVKPLSKAGKGVWNAVTQIEAATICQNADFGSGVNGDLCNSFAWDTAIDFIQKCGANSSYATQSGKSTTSKIATTGTNKLILTGAVDVQCNIYDMAGNCYEWNTETGTDTGYPCVNRGGVYNANVTRRRHSDDTATSFQYNSFRSVLYI